MMMALTKGLSERFKLKIEEGIKAFLGYFPACSCHTTQFRSELFIAFAGASVTLR